MGILVTTMSDLTSILTLTVLYNYYPFFFLAAFPYPLDCFHQETVSFAFTLAMCTGFGT